MHLYVSVNQCVCECVSECVCGRMQTVLCFLSPLPPSPTHSLTPPLHPLTPPPPSHSASRFDDLSLSVKRTGIYFGEHGCAGCLFSSCFLFSSFFVRLPALNSKLTQSLDAWLCYEAVGVASAGFFIGLGMVASTVLGAYLQQNNVFAA